jgi:hypothetical protein
LFLVAATWLRHHPSSLPNLLIRATPGLSDFRIQLMTAMKLRTFSMPKMTVLMRVLVVIASQVLAFENITIGEPACAVSFSKTLLNIHTRIIYRFSCCSDP